MKKECDHFFPILDRVAVRRDPPRTLLGGIKLVNAKVQNSGIVLAVGGGRYENGVLIPMHVKPGDRITFPEGACFEIELDSGEKVLCLLEHNILGLLI